MMSDVQSRVARGIRWCILSIGVAAFGTACSALIGTRDLFLVEGGPGSDETGTDGRTSDSPSGEDGGADVVVPNPCDADLQIDPKNCGACGHDCTNGRCVGRLCILADDLASPGSLAVRSSVYVGLLGGNGNMISCPTSGCASAMVGAKSLSGPDAGEIYPWHVVANDTHVYSSDYLSGNEGGLWRAAVAGNEFLKLPPGVNVERGYGSAIDNKAIYWITTGTGNLHYCDLPNCPTLKSAASVSDGELVAVAADGTLVWSENQGYVLMRCASRTACAPTKLADFVGAVNDLVIDGTTAYWGTTGGEVLSCSIAGCANPTKLVMESPSATIGAVAASGTTLYWSSMVLSADGNSVVDTEGVVKSCTIGKCTRPADIRIIATKQHDPNAMGLDTKSLYWANSGRRGYSDGIGNLVKAPR